MNMVTLIGRIGRIERFATRQGQNITRLSLAIDRWIGQEEKTTDWVNCVAFGKVSDLIFDRFEKGNQLGLLGTVQTRKVDGKNGTIHFTEVRINRLMFVPQRKAISYEPMPQNNEEFIFDENEEVPF